MADLFDKTTRAYRTSNRTCEVRLAEIQGLLKAHAIKQRGDPDNHGFIGDLAHVQLQLAAIIKHLRGEG